MNSIALVATLDPISIESRKTVIEAFQILELAVTTPLGKDEMAAVDAAKAVLLQVDVSVKVA
ncbi:hypothetical protein POF45_26925 [Pseudomonas sp. 681]|uniref:Uncharacterized protein n=1 Tax=Pseudomonas fungipugnans TaxID=3024217 RepID=A0ABT6QVU3_9PSED|nr:hypothetical protein [Pseudomonas sp. 681]MDI2595028.1 hypothetical protein [Pseudomonas sp. 681]